MYVSDPVQFRAITIRAFEEVPCFFCGRNVEVPFVFWLASSQGGDLFLHPECAATLVFRLMRDVHEHKLKTGEDVGLIKREA